MDKQHNISSKLPKNQGTPFAVPDGYFETFQDRLGDAIHQKIPVREKRILHLKPYLAAAVLIIIALVSGNYMLRNNINRSENRFHAEVARVVEQELYSISEETILDALENDHMEEAETSSGTDEMINYLLDENINETDMLNAL
jgi:hypothetical protein